MKDFSMCIAGQSILVTLWHYDANIEKVYAVLKRGWFTGIDRIIIDRALTNGIEHDRFLVIPIHFGQADIDGLFVSDMCHQPWLHHRANRLLEDEPEAVDQSPALTSDQKEAILCEY